MAGALLDIDLSLADEAGGIDESQAAILREIAQRVVDGEQPWG